MADDLPTDLIGFCIDLEGVYNVLSAEKSSAPEWNRFDELVNICATMPPPPNEVAAWPIAASVIIVAILILFSGIFSGLNLGLLGLDLAGLGIVEKGGNEHIKKCARKIMTVRKHGNWLLCSLLLGNVAVNAGLAIFLDNLFKGVVGFIASTSLIVVFGEIVPQALCTRYALQIGARTVWLVWIVMILISPIAWPISKLLDLVLGDEIGTVYNNDELKELISFHINMDDAELQEEIGTMMRGALALPKAEVAGVMTPWKDVFKIDSEAKLDFNMLTHIFKSGHSRIPCVDGNDKVCGLLFVKDLVLLPPQEETPVMTVVDVYGRGVPHVFPNDLLPQVLRDFRTGLSHLAIVREVNNEGPGDPFYYNVGIVTLEDIVEFIVGVDIVDETDVFVDVKDKSRGRGRSSFDIGKLSLFDYRRRLPPSVTPQEAQAIFLHLSGSIQVFKPANKNIHPKELKKLITSSEIVEVIVDQVGADENEQKHVTVEQEERMKDISEGGILLYKRGKASEYFTLILDGKVEVEAGREHFESQLSRWTVLCEDCLVTALDDGRGRFVPDFTAKVIENARILRISRQRFLQSTYKGNEGGPSVAPVFEEEVGIAGAGDRDRLMEDRGDRHNNVAILPTVVGNENDVDIN